MPNVARLASITALFLASACSQTPALRVVPELLGAEGPVFLATGHDRVPLPPGGAIHRGQTIETAEGATALVRLLPNFALQVNSASAVVIEDARLVKNGNAMTDPVRNRQAAARLLRGSLTAVTPPGFTQAELRLNVPGGTIIAPERSAIFVEVSARGSRVANSAGRVSFAESATQTTRPLPAGYYADFDVDGRLRGEPRLTVVDQEAAEQAAAAADTQQLVAELTARLQEARPPWHRGG